MAVKRKPSSIVEAYRILNGSQAGDVEQAQLFLDNMSDDERRARLRSEKQSEVKVRKRKRPMGTGPYPYTSRQYK